MKITQILAILLIVLQINITIQKPLSEAAVVYAIDIGNDQDFESSHGFTYQSDKFFSDNSRIADYRNDGNINQTPIKYADELSLYYTERHADSSFLYKLPFEDQEEGDYVLVVKMCEVYFKQANKRKTDIKIGDSVVERNVDIVGKVGPFAALDLFIPFQFSNNNVYQNGSKLPNGINSNGQLVIEFAKTQYDLPKVDALLILKGGVEDSPKKEYERSIQDHKERLIDEQRAKELENQKREQTRKLLIEEFDSNIDSEYHIGFIQGVTLLLKEPIGISIIVLLVIFFALLKITEQSENIQIRDHTESDKSKQEEVEKKNQ